ncbi:MAG: type I-E CRISPR-associated protein Cse1/CasA [Chlorobium sp.]
MTLENRFNLIDEPWIPVIDKGRLSLRQIFSDASNRGLGGNPLQKMAMTKLLLAVAQAAFTPEDDELLETIETSDLAQKCIEYLDKWYDRFWLYGEKPFLQMPAINGLIERRKRKDLKTATNKAGERNAEASAQPKSLGMGFYPDLPADNNTILTQYQVPKVLSDADKALFIVSLMNFALGGKRTEKNLDILTDGYVGKTGSAKAAPSIGNYIGYLHSILVGETLIDTLLLNLLSHERIAENVYWTTGLGTAPWEEMPKGEDCPIAQNLKRSYMATLVSISRFVLLQGDGIYYVEGLQYPSHKEGWREPSIAVNAGGPTPKIKWIDPNKRPWRELVSLLSFMSAGSGQGYDCQFIRYGLVRFRSRYKRIGIWSGGLKVSANAGDQSVKQDDDFVESLIFLDCAILGELWYHQLQVEMDTLDKLSKTVWAATNGFFKAQNMTDTSLAGQASTLFWELCERNFQTLVDACAPPQDTVRVRKIFAQSAIKAYDTFCPKESARQIDAWAKNRPNLINYLNPENKKP